MQKNSFRNRWASVEGFSFECRHIFSWLLLFAILSACSGPQSKGKGTLEVKIKDHREAIDDFAKLDVPIELIRTKPSGDWIDAKPDLHSIDLTAYRKGNSVTVYKREIDSASFRGLHLKLGRLSGTLKKGDATIEVKNSVVPIQVSFVVEPAQVTVLILDLKVMDLSDHSGRGYELHINAFEHYQGGKLISRIPPA